MAFTTSSNWLMRKLKLSVQWLKNVGVSYCWYIQHLIQFVANYMTSTCRSLLLQHTCDRKLNISLTMLSSMFKNNFAIQQNLLPLPRRFVFSFRLFVCCWDYTKSYLTDFHKSHCKYGTCTMEEPIWYGGHLEHGTLWLQLG